MVSNNNVGWQLMANVFKYGAAGSNNVPEALRSSVVFTAGSAHRFSRLQSSQGLVIAVTGSSCTNGAANDVVATWFEINATN